MNKPSITLLVGALAVAAACLQPAVAQTQTDSTGVSTSTDPAKAEAVERRAQELQAQQTQHADKTIARAPTGAGHKAHAKHKHHRTHRHAKATTGAPAAGTAKR